MSFDDYYQNYYLPKHNKRWTRIFHFIGVAVTICWLTAALALTGGWTLVAFLMAAPFVVYPFAWTSHLLFEGEQGRIPASFTSNPFKAKYGDLRMCYEMVTGRLDWGER